MTGLPEAEKIIDGGQKINYFILVDDVFVLGPYILKLRRQHTRSREWPTIGFHGWESN